ncbi:MAG TPA: hypothetical protein VFS43_21660 [Polyangiaceae bacterium]|nr:hypothetical protein [Polyangiaceae bacterium]
MTREGLFCAAVYWASRASGQAPAYARLAAAGALLGSAGLLADHLGEAALRGERALADGAGWSGFADAVLSGRDGGAP